MEKITIENLVFTYPNQSKPSLNNISLTIMQGEFVTLCGKSGCGKSTLLKHFRSTLAPFGKRDGEIYFENMPIDQMTQREQTEKIGFVQQSPDNQIVTDKVWHELAFGLESLGYSSAEIRSRVAEMASFFGIQTWFHKKTTELSGGQKQLLNLASIMVMQPSILVLDEPTSQLDPIAVTDFLDTIKKINRELGTTILLTEHRLEEALPLSDRVIVMDNGHIITDGTPTEVGQKLKSLGHDMFMAMPTPMRIYASVDNDLQCPITVRDGRYWINEMEHNKQLNKNIIPIDDDVIGQKPMIELNEIWFRYGRELPDVVKGLSVIINQGELFALVGGNGTGKSTSLSIMSGLLTPYRGTVKIDRKLLRNDIKYKNLGNLIGVLPQNPQALFVKKNVKLDLYEMLSERKISKEEQNRRVQEVSELCEIENLLSMHPYDLSGGEQQRAALAKVLLLKPHILFLDEPTKGLDGHFKEKLAEILKKLQSNGVTIVMVSHDIEFCASYATTCGMFFDGSITSIDTPRAFFAGKRFYTTCANRMARSVLPHAIVAEDVIFACGGTIKQKKQFDKPENNLLIREQSGILEKKPIVIQNLTKTRISIAILAFLFFAVTQLYLYQTDVSFPQNFLMIVELVVGFVAMFPRNDSSIPNCSLQTEKKKRKLSKRTLIAIAMVVLAIPLTIYIGIFFLEDRKYYFISFLVLLETMLPFAMIFEGRKPQAREIVIIAVICNIAIAGRTAFFMLPQFKPVVAIVIIAGVCLGAETGFLVGSMTAFVSNMIFGQGTWTPWQMFAFGISGFLSGVLFQTGFLHKKRGALCVYGAFATFFVCGFILDTGSALMWQAKPTFESMLPYYVTGIPFNIIHAIATVFFLWFIAEPMIEKLDRIKIKYGLIENNE